MDLSGAGQTESVPRESAAMDSFRVAYGGTSLWDLEKSNKTNCFEKRENISDI